MGKLPALEVLVVDDNEHVRKSLSLLLQKSGYAVRAVKSGDEALEVLKSAYYDLVISDYKMQPVDGMQLLREVKKNWPATEVIMITAYGTISKGVEAIKRGAFDYITKPFENEEMLKLVSRFVDERGRKQKAQTLISEIRRYSEFDPIIGHSPQILKIMNVVTRVAPSDATVLISGESGTGKELIARAIHARSPRKDQSFVAINCGAIPENLQESELFGHVKGAFTGAAATHKGLFEVSDKGTVFLDEIAEMAPTTQVKLLRFLQNNEIRKVGDSLPQKVDVRLIAATNKNLDEEIRNGRFREDLFYRINVVPITVPPLRERRDDVPLLVEHFIEKYGYVNGRRRVHEVTKRAMSMLINYDWPGNVRELENVIQRAITFADGDEITPAELPEEIRGRKSAPLLRNRRNSSLSDIEANVILETLKEMDGNRKKTAEKLGISKATLWRKLKNIQNLD